MVVWICDGSLPTRPSLTLVAATGKHSLGRAQLYAGVTQNDPMAIVRDVNHASAPVIGFHTTGRLALVVHSVRNLQCQVHNNLHLSIDTVSGLKHAYVLLAFLFKGDLGDSRGGINLPRSKAGVGARIE